MTSGGMLLVLFTLQTGAVSGSDCDGGSCIDESSFLPTQLLTQEKNGQRIINSEEAVVLEEIQRYFTLQEFIAQHLTFENQSEMDKFVEEHASKWAQPASLLGVTSNVSKDEARQLISVHGKCPTKYTNQFFTPRINLCQDSFTGLNSCTESGCYALSSFFYAYSCNTVYYSNAESKTSGYGMCRCIHGSLITWSGLSKMPPWFSYYLGGEKPATRLPSC